MTRQPYVVHILSIRASARRYPGFIDFLRILLTVLFIVMIIPTIQEKRLSFIPDFTCVICKEMYTVCVVRYLSTTLKVNGT